MILCSINVLSVVRVRSQVVRIFDMFYQPWIRVFVDVRGVQYDMMKSKFTDSHRLFRFAWHNIPFTGPSYLHLATSEIWCWPGETGILTELSLCYIIVYHYNGAQWYEQFLQVARLDQALILLGLVLYLPSASVSLVFLVLHIFNFFLLHSLNSLITSWAWWDWPLTWLTNHHPSVLCYDAVGWVIWPVKSSPKWSVMFRVGHKLLLYYTCSQDCIKLLEQLCCCTKAVMFSCLSICLSVCLSFST